MKTGQGHGDFAARLSPEESDGSLTEIFEPPPRSTAEGEEDELFNHKS
jgi:hypothetical protein